MGSGAPPKVNVEGKGPFVATDATVCFNKNSGSHRSANLRKKTESPVRLADWL